MGPAVPNLYHTHSSLLDKAPQGIAAGTLQGNPTWLPMRAINTTDFDQQPAKHHIPHAVTEESQGSRYGSRKVVKTTAAICLTDQSCEAKSISTCSM